MKILNYIIPKSLQNNNFIISLYNQTANSKIISEKQENTLRDILEIEEEFYDLNAINPVPSFQNQYDTILNKIKRNKFKTIKSKNKHIRALKSILSGYPDFKLIDEITAAFNPYRRFR